MGKPLVQRLATSKTIIAPLLPLFLRLSSAVESESNRCVPLLSVGKGIQYMFFISLSIDKSAQYIYLLSLPIDKSTQNRYFTSLSIDKGRQNMYLSSLSTDKDIQYMYFSPFPKDSESVHCNFHALSTTDLAILSYH